MDQSSILGDVSSLKQEEIQMHHTSCEESQMSSEPNQPDSTESVMLVSTSPNQESKPSTTVINGVAPQTDKIADISDNSEVKSSKPKSKKKKKLDPSAPRQPLSGYMRYLNERRDTVRGENPALSFADITKLLAEEWNHLPQDRKQPYVEAGQQDRERYTREFTVYKQTDAYRISLEKQNEKKARKSNNNSENGVLSDTQEVADEVKKDDDGQGSDIHIFTEEFLELNRTCEAEFRQLRNQNTEFEERNALLDKHNEAMKSAIEKMEKANQLLRSNNHALQDHFDDMRTKFVHVIQQVSFPGKNKLPNVNNVDEYISQLERCISSRGVEYEHVSAQLRAYIQKLEFDV